jgi:hypothetical protein
MTGDCQIFLNVETLLVMGFYGTFHKHHENSCGRSRLGTILHGEIINHQPACVEALGTGLTVFAMLPVVQRVFDLPVSENKT